jgi:hypothetical protein
MSRLRTIGTTHATVVAYLALIVAFTGTAVTATGGTFILGTSNKASRTTSLTGTKTEPLALNAPAGKAPLRVNQTPRWRS